MNDSAGKWESSNTRNGPIGKYLKVIWYACLAISMSMFVVSLAGCSEDDDLVSPNPEKPVRSWRTVDFLSAGETTLFQEIWARGIDDIYLRGWNGALSHYDGVQLELVEEAPAQVGAIWGGSSGSLFVGTGSGSIFRFDGAAWLEEDIETGGPIHTIRGAGENDLYALGYGFLCHRSADGWSPVANCPSTTMRSLEVLQDGKVLVGAIASPYLFSEGQWQVLPPLVHVPEAFIGFQPHLVWGRSSTDLYAIGCVDPELSDEGMIQHFDGVQWQVDLRVVMPSVPYGPPRFNSIVDNSNGDVFAFGIGGAVYAKHGGEWNLVDVPTDANLTSAMPLADGSIVVAGWDVLMIYD